LYYRLFIRIKHEKIQATHDVMSLRATLNQPYIWSLFWVNFYVPFMFHSFSKLSLVLVSMFLSCFRGYFLNTWSTTKWIPSIVIIPLQYWNLETTCSKLWWLNNTITIQCLYYRPFIRIKDEKRQANHNVMSFRATLILPYT
jgi:hypothetical protein